MKLQTVLPKNVFLIANAANNARTAAKKVLTKLTQRLRAKPVQNNLAYLSENRIL